MRGSDQTTPTQISVKPDLDQLNDDSLAFPQVQLLILLFLPGFRFPSSIAAMAALGEDLLGTVNKLQDLVFNTIGSDSLDLPQIVGFALGPIGSIILQFLTCFCPGCRRFSVGR